MTENIRNFAASIILSFIIFMNISTSSGSYETSYACQNKILNIECNNGDLINLVRANYGRFSITVCNEHGNVHYSVNCMSPKTLGVLNSICAHKQNCSVEADTSIFGDPCPGTLKYLEAHFQCLPASKIFTMKTTRPTPSWELTTRKLTIAATKTTTTISVTFNNSLPVKSSHNVTTAPVSKIATPTPPKNMNVTLVNSTEFSKKELINETDLKTDMNKSNIIALGERNNYSSTTKTTHIDFYTKFPPNFIKNNNITNSEQSNLFKKQNFNPELSRFNQPTLLNYNKTDGVLRVNEKDKRFCVPTQARNLFWNITYVGEVNVQPCPGGATGIAKWRCVLTPSKNNVTINIPVWHPSSPDLTHCRSLWLNNLELSVNQRELSLISIANDLSQVTSSKILYGGDMQLTTKIIQTMSEKMVYDIGTFPDQRQREVTVNELLTSVVKISSNLLDESQHSSWLDLSHQDQKRVATSLLTGLEYNAFLLADVIGRERVHLQKSRNILLSVNVMETKHIPQSVVFPSEPYQDKIELKRNALIENSEGGLVRIVFAAFNRLESILKPFDSKFRYSSKHNKTNESSFQILNSKVISASLGKGKHIELSQPIILTLKHLQVENVTNPVCVFWNYIDHSWSTDGCSLKHTNKSHTVCICNHLTNFAILMDLIDITLLNNLTSLSVLDTNLSIFIYISTGICILFIIVAIITIQRVLKVRENFSRRSDQESSSNTQSIHENNQQLQEISARPYDRPRANQSNLAAQNSIISNNIINLQMNLDSGNGNTGGSGNNDPTNQGSLHERFHPQIFLNSPHHQFHHHHHHHSNFNSSSPHSNFNSAVVQVTTQNNIFNLPSNANITVNTTTRRPSECGVEHQPLYRSQGFNNFLLANERNYFDVVDRVYDEHNQQKNNSNFNLCLLRDEIFYKK